MHSKTSLLSQRPGLSGTSSEPHSLRLPFSPSLSFPYPQPHPLFAPVEILSIASTPEIKDAIKRANERADSVGANLVGRDTWDLSGLHPRVMLEGSNAIPGQKNRAIVVTFTDFRPDGNEKNQKQAAMVINWVRWMKRHRIHCLVAVCQKELSIKVCACVFVYMLCVLAHVQGRDRGTPAPGPEWRSAAAGVRGRACLVSNLLNRSMHFRRRTPGSCWRRAGALA